MTEPTGATGATAEQIAEAAHRHYTARMPMPNVGDDDWDDRTPEYRQGWIDHMEIVAKYLVPPTHVIVPRDRALDAADAAMFHDDLVTAIAYLRIFRNRCGPNNGDGPILDGLAERLDARLKRLAGQP